MNTTEYERIAEAIAYIDTHAREQPDLEAVAAAVGLSPYHFHRLFRRWAGVTPKRFLQLVTLEHARRRLEESRSVLESTFMAGLSGPGRLHDLFVTLEGVTPGEYREGGAGVEIAFGTAETPFGTALIGRTARGLCHLSFHDDGVAGGLEELSAEWPAARLRTDEAMAADVAERIVSAGDVPLHVRGTNFQLRVWRALLAIPPGAVASYEDVARCLGRPEAVRAVAGAVARNRVGWLIPCHRVIRKLGETGGYRWGATRKRAMLAWEAARSA